MVAETTNLPSLEPRRGFKQDPADFQVKLTNLGIQGLEFVLGGGVPEDSVYFLTGLPGTYYATFAQQAIYNHLSKKGKAVYYTSEVSSTEIVQDMQLYGWDVGDYLDDGSLVFARPLPPQLQAFVQLMPAVQQEQQISLSSAGLGGLTKDFISRLKDERWSVLNLSYLMNAYPPQEITDLVMFWVNAVHKYGGVHFMLLLEGAHDEKQMTVLKNMADGVFNFKFVNGFGQAEGEIEVQKIRRVLPKSKVFRHVVQSDGLAVETTARIG
jgi:KaiC/GvpD/RAD55 family RecA-like ATPase